MKIYDLSHKTVDDQQRITTGNAAANLTDHHSSSYPVTTEATAETAPCEYSHVLLATITLPWIHKTTTKEVISFVSMLENIIFIFSSGVLEI